MLVVFLHIFVTDTKIVFVYNFVAPLKLINRDINNVRQPHIFHILKSIEQKIY